jgi:magnesium transporter
VKRKKTQKPKSNPKIGLPPGASVYIGKERDGAVEIDLISYDETKASFSNNITLQEVQALNPNQIHWINVIGIHDVKMVDELCNIFNIHPLTKEDILNTHSRPKLEIFDEYIFSGLKMLKNEDPDIIIEEEQVSIVFAKNKVISFQEERGDVFEIIRQRIKNPEARVRKRRADYLFFLLHDVIIDYYFNVLTTIEEATDEVEADILAEQWTNVQSDLQGLKSDLIYLKRNLSPVRETVNKILRSEFKYIESDTYKYFNDLHDHMEYVVEGLDTQRELALGHRELYMGMISNKMNQVMKVLALISAIFIPLTFIAGVYGMNFQNMPELKWRYGYFEVLAIMALIAVIMIIYFKKRKWL